MRLENAGYVLRHLFHSQMELVSSKRKEIILLFNKTLLERTVSYQCFSYRELIRNDYSKMIWKIFVETFVSQVLNSFHILANFNVCTYTYTSIFLGLNFITYYILQAFCSKLWLLIFRNGDESSKYNKKNFPLKNNFWNNRMKHSLRKKYTFQKYNDIHQ